MANTKKFFIRFRLIGMLWLFLLVSMSVPALGGDFVFGVNADNWKGQVDNPGFGEAVDKLGAQFIVWHISPEELLSGHGALKLVNFCRDRKLGYLFNTELVNYIPNVPHFQKSDGTYRWDLLPSVMEALKDDPLFWGVVYDEPMLMQAMNKTTAANRTIQPYFADTSSMGALKAHNTVVAKIKELNKYYKSYGKRLVFEMVFPDYAHPVSRGGVVTAPKLMKENFNDLMFYVYSGAARQYNSKELWACVDLWFMDGFPEGGSPGGHTPAELYDALVYSYKAGFDYVYIEHIKGLVDSDFNLTQHGQKVVEFQRVKNSLSRGDWRNIKPAYVVRRFPDGYWGQKYSSFIPDRPYGSHKPHRKLSAAAAKWLAFLNQASNGVIPADANNWNAASHPYFRERKYRSEAGLQPFDLIDHKGEPDSNLNGVKFIDLTK